MGWKEMLTFNIKVNCTSEKWSTTFPQLLHFIYFPQFKMEQSNQNRIVFDGLRFKFDGKCGKIVRGLRYFVDPIQFKNITG